MARKKAPQEPPRRPDPRVVANGAGIGTWTQYIKDLEKYANQLERENKELKKDATS